MWLWSILTVSFFILIILYFFPEVDLKISEYFSKSQKPIILGVMWLISELASIYFILIISFVIAVVLIKNNKYKFLAFYLTSTVLGEAIILLIKEVVQRARPVYFTNLGYSFPSGHATLSMILFGAIIFLLWPKYKEKSLLLLFIPLLIGFSRVYLNVHWLSDIIGGFFIGAIWLLFMSWIFFRGNGSKGLNTFPKN